ncbi:MAG: acetate/propionate family kinase [Myxococcota bacterium]
MHILVINCGSTSIKAAVIDHKTGAREASLDVQRLGPEGGSTAAFDGGEARACPPTHEAALEELLPELIANLGDEVHIEGVGHRAVHGGEDFIRPTRITDEVVGAIESMTDLAPLHTPSNLAGIRMARALLPDIPHVAVFDTAFHNTLPNRALAYALPREVVAEHNIRRYGFHGTSHAYVANKAAEYLGADVRDLRIITCHLGGGCSVTAVEYGRSVETSMGMTPLEGLVMGTRSGDVDPGVLINLLRSGMSVEEVDHMLNRRSGLAGLSGVGSDMRDIERRASDGDEACRRAIQVFSHTVRKYIGAYAATMGGVDAVVFTAGIGENSQVVRHRIAQRLDFLGVRFDEDRNRDAEVVHDHPVAEISDSTSRTKLLVVATDELRKIAEDTAHLAMELDRTAQATRTIPVAISARHVHLAQQTVEALFGEGHQLTRMRDLSQPGQFACEETVTLVGPKRSLERVRVLGPARSRDQVEISRTDEFHLGLDAPVRASGDVEHSPGCTLIGTQGRRVKLEQGVICAWRHIHMTPDDAEHFGVADRDIVEVEVGQGGARSLIFKDVLVRVKESYKLEMHIDTDEGNAAELSRHTEGALVDTEGLATLTRRKIEYDRD